MPRIYYSQMLYNKMASRARNHLSNFHEQTASRPSTSPILSSRPPPSGFFFFFFRDLIERFFRLGWFRHVYGRKRPLLVTSSRSSEERYYYYYYGWWWWWRRKKRFFPQRCFWPTAWTFYSLGERSSSKRQCQKRWHLQTTADGDYYRPPHSFKEMKLLFDPPSSSSSFSDSAVQ